MDCLVYRQSIKFAHDRGISAPRVEIAKQNIPQEVPAMQTGLVSVSFRQLSVDQLIAIAAEAGLDSIEWGGDVHVPPGDIPLARSAGERTRAAGLTVACYGSYYRLTDAEAGMAQQVVDTAEAMGAPLIRVWAGNSGSTNASAALRAEICRNAQHIAGLAAEKGIDIAFEFHGGTLTDTAASARALLDAVDSASTGTLWQPPVGMSTADCIDSIRTVAPYIRNIHVFSWDGTNRLPLQAGAEKWRACLDAIAKLPGDRTLLLEFVRGDEPAQLMQDAACLARWLKGEFGV